jgi:CheY-like chemotaxis protein
LRQSQKLEAVGQLAGGIAHDYNNILAATMMSLSLLEDHGELDADARQLVGDLNLLADRSTKLTRQLLMFSRQSVLRVESIDLNEVLANLHKMLRRLIGEDIAFEFSGETGLPRVKADAGMMEQVVMNLCVNARDALPKGGRLSLRTSVLEIGPEWARANHEARAGRFVCLSVADNGRGMSAETLARVFEPFFTTKEAGKGTGLGLATVYGIVKQHQGWVEARSESGKGSTFSVYLPVTLDGAQEASPEPAAPPRRGTETILLVEDEEPVRAAIAAIMKRYGYRVLAAGSGAEAERIWRANAGEIALLFADMVLPGGMSGLDLAATLREERPGLKVIISSGYSAELSRTGLHAHADFLYLPKPSPATELAAAVRACLDGKAE